MSDFVKCSNCGYEAEIEKITCPECGEILPFIDECSSCEITFSADEQAAMFGGE